MRQPFVNTNTSRDRGHGCSRLSHISTDLYAASSFRTPGILSAIRPISAHEIRPQGRGLAQLATLNTADETWTATRAVAPTTANTNYTALASSAALAIRCFSAKSCKTLYTDARSCFNHSRIRPVRISDPDLTLLLAPETVNAVQLTPLHTS